MSRLRAFTVATLLLCPLCAACPVALPQLNELRFPCTSDDDCADTYQCQEGFCALANWVTADASVLDARTVADVAPQERAVDVRVADTAADVPPRDAGPDSGAVDRPPLDLPSWPDILLPDTARQDILTGTDVGHDAGNDAGNDAGGWVVRPYSCQLNDGDWSFAAPQPLVEVNSADTDRDPYLTPDGLSLYFASSRSGGLGGWDIWVARRPAVDSPFGAPVNAVQFNSASMETRLAISFDGLTAYLSTDRPGGRGGRDLWSSSRARLDQWFAEFTPMANVNTVDHEHDPAPSHDGLRLYFATTSPVATQGDQDIVFSSRTSTTEPFRAPVLMSVVNSSTGEGDPTLSPDERVVLFLSLLTGNGDIYYAAREDRDEVFAAPELLPGVNTDAQEGDPFLSADGCELYFYSDRSGGAGDADIWVARWVDHD